MVASCIITLGSDFPVQSYLFFPGVPILGVGGVRRLYKAELIFLISM